jgi:hypothetical protein
MKQKVQKMYITPKGNKYDSRIIEEILARSLVQTDIILPEDKEFFQRVHDKYWQSQNNS